MFDKGTCICNGEPKFQLLKETKFTFQCYAKRVRDIFLYK